ncbi:MAG: LEA type 2 family protein [Gammaproteobacteria bacterium]
MYVPGRCLSLVVVLLLLTACASLGLREPVRVTVAGLEPLPSEGLEARFVVKLRVQNPNETALEFDGVAIDLELAGIDFGSGVSDQRGTVPRYGEELITVPVTVPFLAIARQVFRLAGDKPANKVPYRLSGHLGGIGLGGVTFDSRGELLLPGHPDRQQ